MELTKPIILLMVFMNCPTAAQSIFLSRGQSATGIFGSYAEAEHATAGGLHIGHSFGGVVDVGLEAGLGTDVMFWGPSLSVLFLNADSLSGPVLSADFSYTQVNYGSVATPFGPRSSDITGSTTLVGGTAGARIAAAPFFVLMPMITGGVSSTSVEGFSDSNGYYGFGMSWIFLTGIATRIVVTPSISRTGDVSTYGIDAGVVLLQH